MAGGLERGNVTVWLRRYGLAIVTTAVAVLGRYLLDPLFGAELPFITFFPATAVVVWAFGIGPAIFSTVLAIIAANVFFLPSRFAPDINLVAWLGVQIVYLLGCAAIIAMGGVARHRQSRGHQMHRELEESETRFRHIADSTPFPLWMSSQNRERTYFNSSWLQLTGNSLDKELGSGWREGVHPEDLRALDASDRSYDERRPYTASYRLRSADDAYRWLSENGIPRFDSNGRFLGFIGTCTDVTEHRVAKESQALLAAIVDASDDAIVSKTLEGVILSWNKAAERLFGYPAEEAVGQSINLIIPLQLRAEENMILRRIRRGEKVDHFETTRIRKDGSCVDISVTVSPVWSSSGAIIGASKVARDISERIRTEEALRASERRYRAVVESQSEMLCRFRPDGTILFANEPCARLLGTTPEALIGVEFWKFIPEPEHPVIRDLLENLTIGLPRERRESRFETAKGIRWVLWTIHALAFDEHGRGTEYQSTGIDITERKLMEEALQEADSRKNAFLAVLGHELRNPLAPLRTGLDLLRRLEGNGATRGTLDMMQRQLNHLVYLVDDLLDVSRISSGRIELKRETIDLRTVIETAVEQARSVIAENQQTLVLDLADEPIGVDGDRDRLVQVVGNLLNNAAKYSKPGGTISLSVRADDGMGVIRVRDTGFGIPAERLTSIFEMFNQVPEHHRDIGAHGGLGIGLSLSRELVSAHGGLIDAHSRGLGFGSEFVVRLPVVDEARESAAPLPPS